MSRQKSFWLLPLLTAGCAVGSAPNAPLMAASVAPPPVAISAARAGADQAEPHTESYARIRDNPFLFAARQPLSTFSIDVDTAAYSNVRRFLNQGRRPPRDAVRIEELVNYFSYEYAGPQGDEPLAVRTEVGRCPWNPKHQLVHIGLQARRLAPGTLPPRNLVFLLDVSGSMAAPNKLPLLKGALRLLVNQLGPADRVAMVVYAGASGLVLPSTPGDRKQTILDAMERLRAGGSTNGGAGIRLAYQVARKQLRKGGVNRVILATDGDFNVGTSSRGALSRLIERERESGVFLTVLGLGMGNLKDDTMEQLADKGNGNYAYLDSMAEARKVLVHEAGATLVTVAKDVKLQVEFNPAQVRAYRLIGYENRLLRAQDFNDDRKDAGDVGAGHSITALYEVVPVGQRADVAHTDALRYQRGPALSRAAASGELMTLKLRFKAPDGHGSQLRVFRTAAAPTAGPSQAFRFSAAVAAFGMLLRDSPHRGAASFQQVVELAQGALGQDEHGYRKEFVALARKAQQLVPAQRAAVAR